MIKHRRIGALSALLMAAAVLLVGIGYFAPSAFAGVTGTAEPPYVSAMDKTKVLDIQIVVDADEWANLLENATAEEYIPATVILDGVKITNVGIRPKGNSSLSMVAQDDTTDRYSFKIEFDHYVSGQTWLGLDKIVVNNMQGDATYMKEYLSYDIMDYIGVEAPLYTFSNIQVNGEAWGFYLAVEALEDSYATRVYGNDHGKLYKPESMEMQGNGQINDSPERVPGGDAEAIQPPVPGSEQVPSRGEGQFPINDSPERAQGGDAEVIQPPVPGSGQVPSRGEGQFPINDSPERVQGGDAEAIQPPAPGSGQVPSRGEGQFPALGAPDAALGGGPGGFGSQAGGAILQYTDDEISSYSAIFENAVFKSTDRDYQRVISALKKLDAGEDLERVVDVEATLKYFAAHTVLVNLDSYISNMSHNYYLYEKDGQLTMLPWDFNLAFGGFQSGSASSVVNFPIDTPVSGVSLEDRPILAKLLEVPEYLSLYHSYLGQIVDGYFSGGTFNQTIDSLDALISPYVAADPTAFYDFAAYQSGVAELKKLGTLRAQSIAGQLDGTIPSTTSGQNANPDALVDAADINLSALGSMGSGGRGGFDRFPGGNAAENGGGIPPSTIPSTISSGSDTEAWIAAGAFAALLLGGLLFVIFYKRRRAA